MSALMLRLHQNTCYRIQVVSSYIHLSPSTYCRQFVARLLLDTNGLYKSAMTWILLCRRDTVNMYPEHDFYFNTAFNEWLLLGHQWLLALPIRCFLTMTLTLCALQKLFYDYDYDHERVTCIRRHVSVDMYVSGYKLLVRDTRFRATSVLV